MNFILQIGCGSATCEYTLKLLPVNFYGGMRANLLQIFLLEFDWEVKMYHKSTIKCVVEDSAVDQPWIKILKPKQTIYKHIMV